MQTRARLSPKPLLFTPHAPACLPVWWAGVSDGCQSIMSRQWFTEHALGCSGFSIHKLAQEGLQR